MNLKEEVRITVKSKINKQVATWNQFKIDLIPDLLHYHLFPCHNHHFDCQVSIAFNEVNGNKFYITKCMKFIK